ncbi:MAG TPA: indole-3-glycerol-phosphate synthase [Woeseiaceae bacterium]|nr:indole-3-glycerol-phosphate synthase [Woeseiaceae bacterium]
MSDFLKKMEAASKARAAAMPPAVAAASLDMPLHALRLGDFDLIAEIKNNSPSEGQLGAAGDDRGLRARNYVRGGAAAISVLTEPSAFGGDLQHLRDVVGAIASSGVPVMRKDFLVDPRQILEARATGASGVLLIAAMLPDAQLQAMLDCAYEHSMFVLLECFDVGDLERCTTLLDDDRHRSQAECMKLLIGVNARNLRTLAVSPERLRKLAPRLPAGAVCVAESGLNSAADAADARQLGYGMALVGTALMKSADPAALIAAMLQAGRAGAIA